MDNNRHKFDLVNCDLRGIISIWVIFVDKCELMIYLTIRNKNFFPLGRYFVTAGNRSNLKGPHSRERESVWVCVWERERERVCECVCVCVYAWERESTNIPLRRPTFPIGQVTVKKSYSVSKISFSSVVTKMKIFHRWHEVDGSFWALPGKSCSLWRYPLLVPER